MRFANFSIHHQLVNYLGIALSPNLRHFVGLVLARFTKLYRLRKVAQGDCLYFYLRLHWPLPISGLLSRLISRIRLRNLLWRQRIRIIIPPHQEDMASMPLSEANKAQPPQPEKSNERSDHESVFILVASARETTGRATAVVYPC